MFTVQPWKWIFILIWDWDEFVLNKAVACQMRFECKVSLAHVMSVMLHSLPLAMTSCFVLLHFSELIFSIHRSWAYPCPNKHVYRYNRWVLFCVISLKGSFSITVPLQEILKSIVTENITFWKVTVGTVNLPSKKMKTVKTIKRETLV